jgi:hypothetical protein
MTENYNLPHPAVRHPTSPHSSRTSTCGGGRGHVALVARRSVLDPSLTLLISGSSLSNSGFLIYTVQALQYFPLTNLLANELTVSLPFSLRPDSGQMEGGEGSGFDGAHMKKRRSSAVRRPRPEGGPAAVQRDNGSPPPLSVTSRSGPRSLLLTSDENATGPDGGNRRREFLLNAPSPERATKGSIRLRSEAAAGGSRKSDGSSHAPEGNREKLGKVKLKIRNVLPKPNPDTSPVKPPRPVDSRHQQKHGHLVSALSYVFILYCGWVCTNSGYGIRLPNPPFEIKWKTSWVANTETNLLRFFSTFLI